MRWSIEVYHRTLKSGCQIEQRQLGTAERLEACLAIDLVGREARLSVRPGGLWRGASAGFPLCLRASVVKAYLGGGRPFRARG